MEDLHKSRLALSIGFHSRIYMGFKSLGSLVDDLLLKIGIGYLL